MDTDTLIEYWTTQREGIDLDAYEIKAILAPIAYHILSSNVSGVIPECELLPLFHQGIIHQRGCDLTTAKHIGRGLLKALGEQSGIFLERGLDAHGQPVYGFLHQTFGEFLAALCLADKVLSDQFQIAEYLHRTMWHEPCLLLAGYLSLVSQTHVSLLLRQILDFNAPFEQELQRNVFLSNECLSDDIQVNPDLRDEILTSLSKALQSQASQVRQKAEDIYKRLALTRHKSSASKILTEIVDLIDPIDSTDPGVRLSIARALIYLDEKDTAKRFLWPLDSGIYRQKIKVYEVQRLRFESWPDQAADYLCHLDSDTNGYPYITPDLNLSKFFIGPIDATTALQVLGKNRLIQLIEDWLENPKEKEDIAKLQLLRALIPQETDYTVLKKMLCPALLPEIRYLVAAILLDTEYRSTAISTLRALMETEPEQGAKAAQMLIEISETDKVNWQLLKDIAIIVDDENSTQAIVTLLQAGDTEFALPSALHLLAIIPPDTHSVQEVRLWPVVETLIHNGYTEIGLTAAHWLALRPGYSYRLHACEALIENGRVEIAIPLLQYIAYECHDDMGKQAFDRLLLLKEADRVVPLLAHISNSNAHEMCYEACLALAMVGHTRETCQLSTCCRTELKLKILEKRTQEYHTALQVFCTKALKTLSTLESSSQGKITQDLCSISRLALNSLSKAHECSYPATTIDYLYNNPWPSIVTSAALFDLRNGNFLRAYRNLVDLLRDKDKRLTLTVHLKILKTIAQIIAPETTELLIDALGSKNEVIRSNAASLLGPLGDIDATEPLLRALKDENAAVRSNAATALGIIGDPASTKALLPLLHDQNRDVRSSSIGALGYVGDDSIVEQVAAALKDPKASCRMTAARALMQLNAKASVQPLLYLLNDENQNVRFWIIQSLSTSSDPKVKRAFLKLLNDENDDVKAVAAYHLANDANNAAIMPLIRLLSSNNLSNIWPVIYGLSFFRHDQFVNDTLLAMLNDRRDGISTFAAIALGYMGQDLAIPHIIEALDCEETKIRELAARALMDVAKSIKHGTLLSLLSDNSSIVRSASIRLLDRFGQPDDLPFILSLMGEEDEYNRHSLVKVLSKNAHTDLVTYLLQEHFAGDGTADSPVFEILSRHRLMEHVPLLIATSIVASDHSACEYAKAIIHLDPASALPVIDRYQRQFRKESQLNQLRGQAMWELSDMDAALVSLKSAAEDLTNDSNLLALAHFYLEQGEIEETKMTLQKALKVRGHRRMCLLSQAVLYWIAGEKEAALAILKDVLRRNPFIADIDDLSYDDFWRDKAITGLQEMLSVLNT